MTFNTGNTSISGTYDETSAGGELNPNIAINNGQPVPYSFAAFNNALGTFSPTAAGQGLFGNTILVYLVSPTQAVFMSIGATTTAGFGPFTPSSALSANPAELYTGQK